MKRFGITLLGALTLGACGGGEVSDDATPAANDGASAPFDAAEPAYVSLTGDPARGQALFAQCAICHTVEPGVQRLGPSLHGVIGRAAGSVDGFAYSPAMRDSAISWSEPELYEYLRDPQGKISGTSMAFAGLADPQNRADLIAWLATRR